jgi:hypothetical protein
MVKYTFSCASSTGFAVDIMLWFNASPVVQYLVSALSSLVFFPSREARCCSRASRRLLGAWKEEKQRKQKRGRG